MPREIHDFEFKGLRLASGANLDILVFDEPGAVQHRWIFKYRYEYPEGRQRLEVPELINDTTLVIEYEDGISQEVQLRMNMVFPEKRGKMFLWGVDVSENSILNAEFIYEKQGLLYRMKTFEWGLGKRMELDKLAPGLVKPVNFPFPLKDRLEPEYGTYKVPFLRTGDEEASFDFPANYQRTREKLESPKQVLES